MTDAACPYKDEAMREEVVEDMPDGVGSTTSIGS